MVKPFRFALQGSNFADRDELIDMAREAESLGYDELYSYDHIGAVDPFVPLLIAAEATTRLRVGPLVLNNEFHHTALLAGSGASLVRLCGAGVGPEMAAGHTQAENDSIGLLLREPGAR